MRGFGLLLVILGAGSLILNIFGYEFKLVGWVDNWGTLIGLGIRAVIIVLGVGLIFFPEEDQSEMRDEQ